MSLQHRLFVEKKTIKYIKFRLTATKKSVEKN